MKTELYTAFQLSAIRITAAVMLLSAVIGSVLHWVLRSLMKIDPPQIGGATGDKIQQVIGNSNPSSPHFQLQGLDVTGTASQSSGIGLSYVVVTVLGILLVAGNFRHGAVMWKVLRGRGRWGLNMLGTVAVEYFRENSALSVILLFRFRPCGRSCGPFLSECLRPCE